MIQIKTLFLFQRNPQNNDQILTLNISEKIGRKMKDSKIVFESVDLLYYSLHKTKIKRKGGPYIKSPEWLRNTRAATNPKNKDDNNCFQYAITIALNHQSIGNNPETKSELNHLLTNITGEV